MRRQMAVAAWVALAVVLAMGPAVAAVPRLHTQGTKWVDAAGRPVTLRGCNLGNWLLQEMWMHTMQLEGIPDQYTLEQVLATRFGEKQKDALLEVYRSNYITGRDFRIIKSFGLNVVRLPIWYTLIEDEAHPYHLRPNAWEHLDRALRSAEVAGLYVILDLHGAAGGQSNEHHTGQEGQNKLWGNAEYQRRTVWLWKQIAARYRDRNVVAGYDLLNEPWAAPQEQVRSLLLECYRAIREVDPDHIIIFAGFPEGFEFLGKPAEQGLTNVAVDMHFYPGVFGGEATVETHEQWLKELPKWQTRLETMGLPMLIGEMNVVFKRAGGAKMMRREFDAYSRLGWATTMWSYKVFGDDGTAGGGWGMVTNRPGAGAPLVKADMWSWPGGSHRFAEASTLGIPRFTAPSTGPVKAYLVVKAGSNEKLDVVLDEIGLTEDATGKSVPMNGSFGAREGWTRWRHRGEIAADYACPEGAPTGGKGPALRLTGTGAVNGGVYVPVTLQGGHSYTVRGVFGDRGSKEAWLEVYLRTDKPVEGADYVAGPAPGAQVNPHTSSAQEIEAYFRSLATAPYVVYEDLRKALRAR
jgi:glucan 1,3-beta-glucosidase